MISHGSQHFVYFSNQRNQSLFYLSKYKTMRKQSATVACGFQRYQVCLLNFSHFFDTSGDRRPTDRHKFGPKSAVWDRMAASESKLRLLSFRGIPRGKGISNTESINNKTLRRLYTESYSNIFRIGSYINNAEAERFCPPIQNNNTVNS